MGTLAIFAATTGASIYMDVKQQKKIEAAQEKQAEIDRATQNEQAARSRRSTIRESMIKRAQIANVAGATEQGKSSSVVSSTQQITGDVGKNIGDINTSLSLANLQTNAQQSLYDAQRVSPLRQISGAGQQAALAFR